MIPKILSGWLQTILGYQDFFILVLFMLIPIVILIPLVRVDADYGKHN